jgi:hypothetical protein
MSDGYTAFKLLSRILGNTGFTWNISYWTTILKKREWGYEDQKWFCEQFQFEQFYGFDHVGES